MFRVSLEGLLGFKLQGSTLVLDPCIPKAWPGFDIRFRHGAGLYEIAVENPGRVNRGVARAELDGKELAARPLRIPLVEDGVNHQIRVVLG
jgi:cyclic beta-1,2-glucan synthetase